MNFVLMVIVPLVLTIIGIILGGSHPGGEKLGHSVGENPVDPIAAERRINYRLIQLQRTRYLKSQARVARYTCFVLALFIAVTGWLYTDAFKARPALQQSSESGTFTSTDDQQIAWALTAVEASPIDSLVSAPATPNENIAATGKLPAQGEWELTNFGTAFNFNDTSLPVGFTLNLSK